ncbi:SMI1/KNR4 family protein [Williamsia sp. SKLECPSW1]
MRVSSEWTELMAALDSLSDRALTFQPPAPAADLAAAEAATDAEWPEQLREFYTLHNGQDPDKPGRFHGELLPMTLIFSIDHLVEEYRMMVEYGRSEIADDLWMRENAQDSQAGSTAWCWLPSYIPIAGLDSNYYFIDTRPGPHSGCIREWSRDDGDNGSEPIWDSIAEMLAAVRRSVLTDAVLLEPWHPWFVHDEDNENYHGTLTWNATIAQPLSAKPPAVPDPTPLHVPFPLIDFMPSEIGPDDDCVDLDAVSASAAAVARRLHPAATIDGGNFVYQRVPRRQGITANWFAVIDGEPAAFLVIITGDGDRVFVHQHPPGGFTLTTD